MMPDQSTKNTKRRQQGRPPTRPAVVDQILSLARNGWTRNAIAADCGLSKGTVTTICHKNGFYFERGGDRRSEEAKNTRREALGWVFDKTVPVDLAATWACSAYTAGQLQTAYRGQRALPKRLKKIFGGEAGRFIKI